MQAIEVKYLGPTDARGSRLKATCRAGSITIGWDYALDDDNYIKAARELCVKVGWANWPERLIEGTLANGNKVFVFNPLEVAA